MARTVKWHPENHFEEYLRRILFPYDSMEINIEIFVENVLSLGLLD